MPDKSSMKKYGKMLDEIASKYPELEEAVADFQGELAGALETPPEGGESESETAGDDEMPAMPFPLAKKKGPAAADEEEATEDEDESAYTF